MSTTCYLLVQHARGAACADLEPWPTSWPRAGRRGRSSFAEIEAGLRFAWLLTGVPNDDTPASVLATLEQLAGLERHRGVRTRLSLPAVLAALEHAGPRHPRLAVICGWLRTHERCATEVIFDVHCNTSGIYTDDFTCDE